MGYDKVKTAVYDKDGDFMFCFESMTEASKKMDVEISNISMCFKLGIRLKGNYYVKIENDLAIPKTIPIKKYRQGGKAVVIYKRPRTIWKIACSLQEASDIVGASITSIRTHIHKKQWHERTNLFYEFADPDDLINRMHQFAPNYIPSTSRNNKSRIRATNGNFSQEYDSISECARDLKISRVGIIHVLKGRQEHAGGYKVENI